MWLSSQNPHSVILNGAGRGAKHIVLRSRRTPISPRDRGKHSSAKAPLFTISGFRASACATVDELEPVRNGMTRLSRLRENSPFASSSRFVSGHRLSEAVSCSVSTAPFRGCECRGQRAFRPSRFSTRSPLPLSGYNIWCFPLDRHYRREYLKHPRALFFGPPLLKGATIIGAGATLS